MSLTKRSVQGASRAALIFVSLGLATALIVSIVTATPKVASADTTSAAAPVKWSSIGPRDAGGWGGKVNAFAYVKNKPSVMYIGGGWGNTPRESTSQMGIYRTNDG